MEHNENTKLPTKLDPFWRGAPQCVMAWAALQRDGGIMVSSIRPRPEDVKLACGNDCVPIRVMVTYWAEENHDAD